MGLVLGVRLPSTLHVADPVSLNISVHPFLPLLCLQTSTATARLLLYPFHSAQRLASLYTAAEQSEFCTPRHAWLPAGDGVVVTSEDGVLRTVDLQGKVRSRVGVHGAASPAEEGEVDPVSERARQRREIVRGSSVVKDVAVLVDAQGELQYVSCGFDKTIRLVSVSVVPS